MVFAELLRRAGLDSSPAALDAVMLEVDTIQAVNKLDFVAAAALVLAYLKPLAEGKDKAPSVVIRGRLPDGQPAGPGDLVGTVAFHGPGDYRWTIDDGSAVASRGDKPEPTSCEAWIAAVKRAADGRCAT